MSRNTAWRFIHPDLDQDPSLVAVSGDQTPPGGLVLSPNGRVAMVSGNDVIRQSILLLLSTRPGERVMRPAYGCNLSALVFEANDDTTAALALYQVRKALLQWEPRVDILRLDAVREPENPNILTIILEYQVRLTQAREEIQISLDQQAPR